VTAQCVSPSPCEDLASIFHLRGEKSVFPDSPPELFSRTSQHPELGAVDVYDFKITRIAVFSHKGQTAQDLYSSMVVMLL
jgi:hypothetical protein